MKYTKEQLAAARAAKSPEELMTMAKDAGIEITPEQAARFVGQHRALSDEELENVAGGRCASEDPHQRAMT